LPRPDISDIIATHIGPFPQTEGLLEMAAVPTAEKTPEVGG